MHSEGTKTHHPDRPLFIAPLLSSFSSCVCGCVCVSVCLSICLSASVFLVLESHQQASSRAYWNELSSPHIHVEALCVGAAVVFELLQSSGYHVVVLMILEYCCDGLQHHLFFLIHKILDQERISAPMSLSTLHMRLSCRHFQEKKSWIWDTAHILLDWYQLYWTKLA